MNVRHMHEARATIIIPVERFNPDWLNESITSALTQNYSNYDVIIANCTRDIEFIELNRDFDSCVKQIKIRESIPNYSWKTFIKAISGHVLFFLSPGDRFHPDKIQEHMALRNEYSIVNLSYNAKFLVDSKNEIWFQESIPPTRNEIDFLNNLPIRISDIVVSKDKLLEIMESDNCFGSAIRDSIFILRYLSNGSTIAGINKPLSYQKQWIDYYSLEQNSDEFLELLGFADEYFSDPKRSRKVRNRRNHILSRIYLTGAFHAFIRNKTLDGQKFIREAVHADRSILNDQAKMLLEQLISLCLTTDDDIGSYINQVFSQLPSELQWITQYHQIVIAKVYLLRGVADILYGRANQAELKFRKSAAHGIQLENQLMLEILAQVSAYEEAFGPHDAQAAVHTIGKKLIVIGKRNEAGWLVGTFFINRAFNNYQEKQYDLVLPDVFNAINFQPKFLLNPGVISIIFRSARKSILRSSKFPYSMDLAERR